MKIITVLKQEIFKKTWSIFTSIGLWKEDDYITRHVTLFDTDEIKSHVKRVFFFLKRGNGVGIFRFKAIRDESNDQAGLPWSVGRFYEDTNHQDNHENQNLRKIWGKTLVKIDNHLCIE